MSVFTNALESIGALSRSPDENLLNPVTVKAPQFNNLSPEDYQRILQVAKTLAPQMVTTGPALQNALRNRMRTTADQTAERFNMRGQAGPNSGLFAAGMGRAAADTGAEAELSQQQELSKALQDTFAGNAGREFSGRSTQYGGDLNAALANAANTQAANQARYASQSATRSGQMGAITGGIGALANIFAPGIGSDLAGPLTPPPTPSPTNDLSQVYAAYGQGVAGGQPGMRRRFPQNNSSVRPTGPVPVVNY